MSDDGIDFVPSNPEGEPGDEVLDTGTRDRRPRWLLPVAIAALLVIALLVVQHQHSSAPSAAAPSTGASQSLPQRFRPVVVPTEGTQLDGGFERPIDRGADVLDVLVSADTWWELKARSITRWGQFGIQSQARLPVPVTNRDNPELLLDLSTQTLWLINLGRQNSTLYSFENVTLLPQRVIHVARPIVGAATLDGRLFLSENTRLVEVPQRGRPVVVARSARGGFDTVVTDSARSGLLVASYGGPTTLRRVVVSGAGAVRVTHSARLPFAKATLAVVNGAIWIGGFRQDGAALYRLNPDTLRPQTTSPLVRNLGPGAVIVAGGVLDVWVRDGGSGALHCIDGAAGNPLQHWMIDGPVSSGGGNALVATTTGMIPLALRSCSG